MCIRDRPDTVDFLVESAKNQDVRRADVYKRQRQHAPLAGPGHRIAPGLERLAQAHQVVGGLGGQGVRGQGQQIDVAPARLVVPQRRRADQVD